MDWVKITKDNPAPMGMQRFKVNGETKVGYKWQFPKATHWTTLNVIY